MSYPQGQPPPRAQAPPDPPQPDGPDPADRYPEDPDSDWERMQDEGVFPPWI